MKKKVLASILTVVLTAGILIGCGAAEQATTEATTEEVTTEVADATTLEDGTYQAEFNTDSGMFHVNEANEGKGVLTVENGEMTLHISLPSKNIVNLYPGLAEDAEKASAELLEPTADMVTYSDGAEEEVNGFDIPVPAIGTEFDLALLGTKGKWYDHKVSVDNPEVTQLQDGTYLVDISLEGGSGRATIESPTTVQVTNQEAKVEIVWNSSNYDYMKIQDEIYYPVNTEGNSVFLIPVTSWDEPMEVVADTTAMSTPHEITYTIELDSSSILRKIVEHAMTDSTTDHDISSQLTYDHGMQLDYATEFAVDYYRNGFRLISISDGSRYLLNTEQKEIPQDLPEDIVVLHDEAQRIYLVASATMDMFCKMDAMDTIALSGIAQENWSIAQAREAMESGKLSYAGKYNEPDYESILSSNCDIAIESTMIYHTPDVKEKLENLGIPVLVDHSSYEAHPLGRTEWVKLYGVLIGREQEAIAAFHSQEKQFQELGEVKNTGKTVVFFYITTNQTVVVRKPNDYVSKMIELAGGNYLFQDLAKGDTASSSVNMQLEEFYAKAKDADYLVYNSTIEGEIQSLSDLLNRCALLKDFRAVSHGTVWCTTQNVYQDSMSTGQMIREFHEMLTEGDTEDGEAVYLYKLL